MESFHPLLNLLGGSSKRLESTEPPPAKSARTEQGGGSPPLVAPDFVTADRSPSESGSRGQLGGGSSDASPEEKTVRLSLESSLAPPRGDDVLKLLAVSSSSSAATAGLYWGLDFLPEATAQVQKLLVVRHVFNKAKEACPTFYFVSKPYCNVPFDFVASQSNFMLPFENTVCNVLLRKLFFLSKKYLVLEVVVVDDFINKSLVKGAPTFAVIAMHENTGTHFYYSQCKLAMTDALNQRQLLGDAAKAQSFPNWCLGDIRARCVLRRHFKDT